MCPCYTLHCGSQAIHWWENWSLVKSWAENRFMTHWHQVMVTQRCLYSIDMYSTDRFSPSSCIFCKQILFSKRTQKWLNCVSRNDSWTQKCLEKCLSSTPWHNGMRGHWFSLNACQTFDCFHCRMSSETWSRKTHFTQSQICMPGSPCLSLGGGEGHKKFAVHNRRGSL